MSGVILKYYNVVTGLTISYTLGLVSSLTYVVFYHEIKDSHWIIPVIIVIGRIGGSMGFNVQYVSIPRLFPAKIVASVFGFINFFAHLITVGAPMVAELEDPIPMLVFATNAFLAIVFCRYLTEKDEEDLEDSFDSKE